MLNQKGTTPFLVPLIIVAALIGGFFLISKNSTNTSEAPSASPSSSIQWETYKDEEGGYSLKLPKGWTVENLPIENTKLIKVTAEDKTAFVLIEGIVGPNLEKEGELEKVIDLLEDKLKKNSNIKINALTRLNENDMSGYLAIGEETYEGKTVEFEERFIVWKNGRGLRLDGAYSP